MDLRVLIVADNASSQFGGEAALPLHYYRILRRRGIPTWLVVHARTRAELQKLFPLDHDRIVFVPDTAAHRALWRLGELLPARISSFTTGFIARCITQAAQRRLIYRIIHKCNINVIHQPTPVSPKEPSLIYGMGVPVVIGPMNGGMDYPPQFLKRQGHIERIFVATGRWVANVANRMMPGKRQAAMLLVANERTRAALPSGTCTRVVTVVENGVDLTLWKEFAHAHGGVSSTGLTRFAFVGRLIAWKAVDMLLLAFKRAADEGPIKLVIIGDGCERANLERLARTLDILQSPDSDQPGKVSFLGWMSQADCAARLRECDALVLPSLLECGGAVVLEAMAIAKPVIATAWGGPADYLDPSCGILLEPAPRNVFIANLASAMTTLAKHPQDRAAKGRAGRVKVVTQFDWEVKVDQMLEIYQAVARGDCRAPRTDSR